MAQQNNQRDNNRNEVALVPVDALRPARLPVTTAMLERLQIAEGDYRVLVESVFPNAKTVEAISLALSYCRHRNLDVMKRPVNIVPMYSKQLKRMVETIWPSIAEIRTTAARTGVYAGIDDSEFGPLIEREFKEVIEDERDPRNNSTRTHTITYPEWCKIVVYRLVGGVRCPFHATVYWLEAYATVARNQEMPNDVWRRRVFGQIEKCCEAAALRRAFPEELGNEYAAEEMAGRELVDDSVAFAVIPEAPRPPRPTPAPPPKAAPPPPPEQTAGKGGTPATAAPQAAQRGDQARSPAPADMRNVEDAIVEDLPGDQDDRRIDDTELDDNAFFYEFEERMREAPTAEIVEEVWSNLGPEQRFANDENGLRICLNIKTLRLNVLAGKARYRDEEVDR